MASKPRIPLPQRIKVGPLTYKVAYWTNEDLHGHGDILYYGRCMKPTCTIYLRPGLADCRLREVLVHELLHAAFDVTGLDQQEGANEEATVSALAYPILAILRDNPDLVAFLTAKE